MLHPAGHLLRRAAEADQCFPPGRLRRAGVGKSPPPPPPRTDSPLTPAVPVAPARLARCFSLGRHADPARAAQPDMHGRRRMRAARRPPAGDVAAAGRGAAARPQLGPRCAALQVPPCRPLAL